MANTIEVSNNKTIKNLTTSLILSKYSTSVNSFPPSCSKEAYLFIFFTYFSNGVPKKASFNNTDKNPTLQLWL